MVRYKKRFFVVEFERASSVAKGTEGVDLSPLDSSESDLEKAVKNQITELHGDHGRGSVTLGLKVMYAHAGSRLAVLRARHGPHKLVASSLPFVTKIKQQDVVPRLLYTGATVKHCYIFMQKRQKAVLQAALQSLSQSDTVAQEKMKSWLLKLKTM